MFLQMHAYIFFLTIPHWLKHVFGLQVQQFITLCYPEDMTSHQAHQTKELCENCLTLEKYISFTSPICRNFENNSEILIKV